MSAGSELSRARRLWLGAEPLHAVVYFAPETAEACKAIGLKGFWMGYFAGRAAPMGPVAPAVVDATFFNFHPTMVRRALPDAWALSDPATVLATRWDSATQALRRLIDDGAAVEGAAGLARAACEGLGHEGRPLAAAWADVAWRDEPVADLWLACTVLREHRGDGHVAALVDVGVGGLEAHVLADATRAIPREALQPNRGWTDEDWADAQRRLRERGLLDARGVATAEGHALREHVERRTDELALPPLRALGPQRAERLIAALVALVPCVAPALPFPNPIGLPAPSAS